MGLHKGKKERDGVATSYHRILSVTMTTNSHNSIVVVSYVDEEARQADNASGSGIRPYRQATTYETDYDPSMSVDSAYNWLKRQPDFKGAKDV